MTEPVTQCFSYTFNYQTYQLLLCMLSMFSQFRVWSVCLLCMSAAVRAWLLWRSFWTTETHSDPRMDTLCGGWTRSLTSEQSAHRTTHGSLLAVTKTIAHITHTVAPLRVCQRADKTAQLPTQTQWNNTHFPLGPVQPVYVVKQYSKWCFGKGTKREKFKSQTIIMILLTVHYSVTKSIEKNA